MEKKYFRCHVCQDIHLGLKPPKICPTCLAENAYIEIEQKEALKIFDLLNNKEVEH